MKSILIVLLYLFCLIPVYTQNYFFDVHGDYERAITKDQLVGVKTMGDLIIGYPQNWVSNYIGVTLQTKTQGVTMKAIGSNDTLTFEQNKLLQHTELGTVITITIEYQARNAVSKMMENNSMIVNFTLVPEFEAEFLGGKDLLTEYLMAKTSHLFSNTPDNGIQATKVVFTVNEEGSIIDVQLLKSSTSKKFDDALLETINKMPKWRAAKLKNGQLVKQKFELLFSNNGC